MSINKISSPPIPSMAYVNNWWDFSSSNSGNTNFSMIYNVFNNSTGTGSPISDDRPSPKPNGSSPFSVSRILESFISFDKFPMLTGSTGSTGCYVNYTLAVGEQYGSTITSGITFYTGITINGTLQYRDIPGYSVNFANYIMTGTSGQFLTNSQITIPSLGISRGTRARKEDNFTLSFYNDPRYAKAAYFNITRVTSSGTTFPVYLPMPTATGNTAAFVQHIGVGPGNLLTSGNAINYDTDSYYYVQLIDSIQIGFFNPKSEKFYINLDQGGKRYPAKEFIFKNGRGQAEHITFSLVSQENINITRDQYQKNLEYNYSVGDRGYVTENINAQESWIFNTDYITESENIVVKEFLISPEIYYLDTSDGTMIPYVVTSSSSSFKTNAVDHLIQYTVEVEPAFLLNTQR